MSPGILFDFATVSYLLLCAKHNTGFEAERSGVDPAGFQSQALPKVAKARHVAFAVYF